MYRRTMSKVVVFALLAAGAVSAAVLASRNYGPCPTGTLTELAPWREYDMTGCGMQFGGHVSNDEGHFAYRQLTGDFDIIAQVIYYSPDGGDEGGVGIMARTSLDANATFVEMKYMSPAFGDEFYFSVRSRPGGSFFVPGYSVFYADMDAYAQPPVWIRLVRRGRTFDGAVSKNGTQWLKISTPQHLLPDEGDADPNANQNLDWPATLYIGFTVCSDNSKLALAKLRAVSGLDGTPAMAPAAGAGAPRRAERAPDAATYDVRGRLLRTPAGPAPGVVVAGNGTGLARAALRLR